MLRDIDGRASDECCTYVFIAEEEVSEIEWNER